MAVSSSVVSRLGSRLMLTCEDSEDGSFEEEVPCVGTGKRSGIWRPRVGKDCGVSERLDRERAASSSSSSSSASDLGCASLAVGDLALPFECLSSSCLICCCFLGSWVGERKSEIESQAMEVEVRATR